MLQFFSCFVNRRQVLPAVVHLLYTVQVVSSYSVSEFSQFVKLIITSRGEVL